VRRGWKILIGVLVALAVLLAINLLIVNAQTKDAAVTVDGGQILSLPGGDVQVTDSGDPKGANPGAPIVLIHCFGCSLNWWDGMMPLLTRNHRVIRIDLLGHGGSAKPKSGYAIEDQARLGAGALDRLGVQGAVVVGHSLGASVAVSLAQQASELVDRVAIIDQAPDSSYGGLDFLSKVTTWPVIGQAMWRVKFGSLIKQGYKQAFAPGYDIESGFENPDQVVEDNKAMTFTSYTDTIDAEEDFTDAMPLDERMRQAAVPLMVIFGSEDQIYDVGPALSAYKAVPGVRTAEIQGAGHSPNVEKPQETARLVLEFAADASDDSIPPPPPNIGQNKPGGGGKPNNNGSNGTKPNNKRRHHAQGSGGTSGPSSRGSGNNSGGVGSG
jgi:pimeloyl-ACP methyl ester carboxylesterase